MRIVSRFAGFGLNLRFREMFQFGGQRWHRVREAGIRQLFTALKMTALQIVEAMRRIAPGPRHRLGPTIATAAIFMVSGCPSAHGHERLL
jgi:hypothetical protein